MRATVLPALVLLVPAFAMAAGSLAAQAGEPAQIRLRHGSFDPLAAAPAVPPALRADPTSQLFLVQLVAPLEDSARARLDREGARVLWYVPERSYLVRMSADCAARLAGDDGVRWVGPYHTLYKLEPALAAEWLAGQQPPRRRYDITVAAAHADRAPLAAAIAGLGGEVHTAPGAGLLVSATLSWPQLQAVARLDQTVWIDRWGAPETDMDLVRIIHGVAYAEAVGGYVGRGVRGHVYEGVHAENPAFAPSAYRTWPIGVFNTAPSTHGSAVFAILFASGTPPSARGILPEGQGLYTAMNGAGLTRSEFARQLADPELPYRAMFQVAAWGGSLGNAYSSLSAEMDLAVFDADLPIIQSLGNAGAPSGRPEAWAKNVISVGGVMHRNNLDPADDCWCGLASTGPAPDGRVKPDFVAACDSVQTLSGPTSAVTQFGGSSAATAIVAGLVGSSIELFTDGLFGYPAAPSWERRFGYTAHHSTTKALLVNTARQYPFAGANHDLSRHRQGWGVPNVQQLLDQRDRLLVIDELDVLRQGGARSYRVFVPPGMPEMRATLCYSDPPALPAAALQRVNSLDLRVVDPSGVVYWGNRGLRQGTSSVPGGGPEDVDVVENVWIAAPQGGVYTVEVQAPAIRQDGHVETPQVDADYALVVGGLGGIRDRSGMALDLAAPQPGELSVSLARVPAGFAGGLTLMSADTSRAVATGSLFGLEADALTAAIAALPPAEGNPLSFAPTAQPGAFPNAAFHFPAGLAQALRGVTLDAVALVYDSQLGVLAVSNVARVTVP